MHYICTDERYNLLIVRFYGVHFSNPFTMFKPLIDLILGRRRNVPRSTTEHTHFNFVTQVDEYDTNLDDFVTVHWTYYVRTTSAGIIDRKVHITDIAIGDRMLITDEGYEAIVEVFGQKSLFPHFVRVDDKNKTIIIEFLSPINLP